MYPQLCKTERGYHVDHENPSHTAIATSPANASAIRYAVMPASFVRMIRHARPRAGHPRLSLSMLQKTWRAGTSPAMTKTARHELNVRHDRVASDHFRREPYPSWRDPHIGSSRQGRVRTWTWPRRVPARSRVPANGACSGKVRSGFPRRSCSTIKGSDGSSLATLRRRCVGRMWRRDVRPPSDSKIPIKKARGRSPGAGLILAMLDICR